MSILSGFKKIKRYMKESSGYKLLSQWTSSHTVEMDDGTTLQHTIESVEDSLASKAAIESPDLTGSPKAPTAAAGTNTTQIANTAFVQSTLSSAVSNHNTSGSAHNDLRSLISGLTATVSNKVDKVSGKGLSTNDYTTTEKNKLGGIASGAEVNVQPDWNVTDTNSDAFIKNKPSSMPASDVYSWAKASTKPSYSKSEVGLGSVPNVATNDQTPSFTEAGTRANISSGEKLSVILGKIKKYFTDLKTVAFTGSYTDLSNKPSIPAVPSSLPANGGTAQTISETLPITKGGTGKTTGADAANGLINSLTVGTSNPVDDDYYVCQYAGGGATNTTFTRRKISCLWNYIKGKLATVATSGNYNDLSNKPTIPANTWRGIQNNLTSDSTTDSLAAAQGKALKTLVDGKLPLSGGTMTGALNIGQNRFYMNIDAYYTLVTETALTTGTMTMNTYDNRKISNFSFLTFILINSNGKIVETINIPYAIFKNKGIQFINGNAAFSWKSDTAFIGAGQSSYKIMITAAFPKMPL